MQAFAMFASDLDATSRRQLARGERLTELLRQSQFHPYPVEDQVVSVWAGINGLMDDVPVDDILRFEQELLDHLRHHSQILSTIAETNEFDDDTAEAVRKAAADLKKEFRTSEGHLLPGHEEHEPIDDEDLDKEQIVVSKKG